jgi:hypothetical protein
LMFVVISSILHIIRDFRNFKIGPEVV